MGARREREPIHRQALRCPACWREPEGRAAARMRVGIMNRRLYIHLMESSNFLACFITPGYMASVTNHFRIAAGGL